MADEFVTVECTRCGAVAARVPSGAVPLAMRGMVGVVVNALKSYGVVCGRPECAKRAVT